MPFAEPSNRAARWPAIAAPCAFPRERGADGASDERGMNTHVAVEVHTIIYRLQCITAHDCGNAFSLFVVVNVLYSVDAHAYTVTGIALRTLQQPLQGTQKGFRARWSRTV